MTENSDVFARLVSERRSCRRYRPDPVSRDGLEQLLEAARLAPSACNAQPWRFMVVTEAATRNRLVREGFLPGLKMDWALEAPAIVVAGIERSVVTHRLAPVVSGVDYALLDLGIAGEHLVLQAAALGLGSCWIGWVRPKAVRRIVGWPRGIEPQAMITVGWPAEPPGDTPRKRLDEIAGWIE